MIYASARQSRTRPAGHQRIFGGARRGVKAAAGAALGAALTVGAAACGSSGGSVPAGAPVSHPQAPASSPGGMSMLGAHSLPAQASQTLPSFPAFYDAHTDVVVVTDAFPAAAAQAFHANYAPSLSVVHAASQPAWYIIRGPAAPGQIAVLGSEPGESDYSPLWQTVIVRWRPGVTPKVLTSDNMILALAKQGQLTITKTAMVINAPVITKP